MKCKDCKNYVKDCYGHSGYCKMIEEKFPGRNRLVGCNKQACEQFENKTNKKA